MAFACLLRLLPKDQIYNRIIVYDPLPPFRSVASPIYLSIPGSHQPAAAPSWSAMPCRAMSKTIHLLKQIFSVISPASPLILHCPLSLFVNVLGNERKVTEACSSPLTAAVRCTPRHSTRLRPDSAFTTCTFSTQAVLQTGLSVKLTTFLLNI